MAIGCRRWRDERLSWRQIIDRRGGGCPAALAGTHPLFGSGHSGDPTQTLFVINADLLNEALVRCFRSSNHIGMLFHPHPRATASPLSRGASRSDASRRMAAPYAIVAILRDARAR